MIIYKITNQVNGKMYVGQTIQTLKRRMSYHKCTSSKCTALKSAFDKYGIDNFTIEIIANATSLEELCLLEKKLIQELGTLAPFGYNLTTGGERPIYSEITRERLSVAGKGRKAWNKGLNKSDPRVAKYVKYGDEHHLKGKTSSLKGSKKSESSRLKMSQSALARKPMSQATKLKMSVSRKKTSVLCDQNLKTYPSINSAAKDLNLNLGNVHQAVSGKKKHVKGYTFKKV